MRDWLIATATAVAVLCLGAVVLFLLVLLAALTDQLLVVLS